MTVVRVVNNYLDPLISPNGVLLANTDIVFQLVDVAKRQAAALFDALDGSYVVGNPVTATTDGAAYFTVNLWPNSRGEYATCYKVTLPNTNFKPVYIQVTEGEGNLTFLAARTNMEAMTPQTETIFGALLASITQALGTATSPVTDTTNGLMTYGEHLRLANTSGTNTGDQDLSGLVAKSGSLTDIATRNHSDLSGIGTNTHAQIDTALTRLANTSGTNSGTNTGDQDLSALVSKTGDETITGQKRFGLAPLMPNDICYWMDGQSGRPTYAAWIASPSTVMLDSVFTAAYAAVSEVWLPDGTFSVSGTITLDGSTGLKRLIGSSMRKTIIVQTDMTEAVLSVGSFVQVEHIKVQQLSGAPTRADNSAYTVGAYVLWPNLTSLWQCTTAGTTASTAPDVSGKVVGNTVTDGTAVWTMVSLDSGVGINVTSRLERNSYIKNVLIQNTTIGLYGKNQFAYSTLFENIEIAYYRRYGLYGNDTGATGNIYDNIYGNNWNDYTAKTKNSAIAFFVLTGSHEGGEARQINVEHGIFNSAIRLIGVKNFTLSTHIEGYIANTAANYGAVIQATGYSNVKLKVDFVWGGTQGTAITGFDKSAMVAYALFGVDTGSLIELEGVDCRNNTVTAGSGQLYISYRQGSIAAPDPTINASDVVAVDVFNNHYLPASSPEIVILKKWNHLNYDLNLNGKKLRNGTAAPTTGTWVVGDMVLNSVPAAGQPRGWVCVAAGTPGTWVTFESLDTSKVPFDSPTFTGTPAAPTAAADTSTTQLATTAFVIGQVATTTPVVTATGGAGVVGTSKKYARADHAHPKGDAVTVNGYGTSQSGAAVSCMVTDGNGNLGLGTTPDTWASANRAIQVGFSGALFASTSSTATSFANNVYDNGIARYRTSNAAALYQQSGAGHYWFNAPTGTAGAALTWALALSLDSTGALAPGIDNTQTCGSAAKRWSTLYAGTGTINTSDAREKTAVQVLTDAEISAASALSKEIGTYRFLSAIAEKGEAARFHVGMTVQRAIEIIQSFGLDPFKYGFICHDEWGADADTGTAAGDRYSFRPDEILFFIARGIEARLTVLENR